jgi:hypothetical protein
LNPCINPTTTSPLNLVGFQIFFKSKRDATHTMGYSKPPQDLRLNSATGGFDQSGIPYKNLSRHPIQSSATHLRTSSDKGSLHLLHAGVGWRLRVVNVLRLQPAYFTSGQLHYGCLVNVTVIIPARQSWSIPVKVIIIFGGSFPLDNENNVPVPPQCPGIHACSE